MTAIGWAARIRRHAPALLGLAIFLAFVAPVLAPGVQLYYRDTGRLYYPVKLYIAQALAHGRIAWWDSMTEAGLSLLGQVTPGLLHPFTLLYAVLPFDLAFKLNHLAGLLLGGIGAWRLARRLGASPWAALAGAVAYGGSGYLVSMADSNLPYALGAGMLPIAIDGLVGFLEQRTPLRLLWAAAALALVGYGGDPQSMWFAGLIGGAWAVARGAGEAGWRGALRGAGLTASWAALGLALAAPMALPAVAQLRRTSRASGLTAVEQKMFANHPARLLGLLIPRAFDDVPERGGGEASIHGLSYFQEYFAGDEPPFADSIVFGAPALLFAGCAAFAGRRGRMLLLGAVVLALASTGEALGIERIIQDAVPGARLFRYAEKVMGPAILLLALAASLGIDRALGSGRRAAGILAAIAAAWAAAGAAVVWMAGSGPALSTVVAWGRLHDPALAARFLAELRAGTSDAAGLAAVVALVAALRAARGGIGLAGLGAICCAASVFASSAGLLYVTAAELLRGPYLLGELLIRRAGPSPGRWRLFVDQSPPPVLKALPERVGITYGYAQSLQPQFNSVNDIEGAASYFSAEDTHYKALRMRAGAVFGSLLDVQYYVEMPARLSASRPPDGDSFVLGPGYRVKELRGGPRAFLVSRGQAVPTNAEALRRLASGEIDPHREAVIVGKDVGVPSGPAVALPPVVVRRPVPEQFLMETDAPMAALLVVSEHFDPGWRATVDGRPAPALEVDLAALGVPVPEGRHAVELRFSPSGLGAGLGIAAATMAALLLAAFFRKRQRS